MMRAESVMHEKNYWVGKVSGLGAWMLVIISLVPAATSAALINSYDFDGDLTDTLGNGVDLVASGGTISNGRYVFDNNQGLNLASALSSTTSYQIEIKFQMTTNPTFWNKLVDFESLSSDIGLYVGSDRFRFFTDSSNGADPIPLNTDVTAILIRDGSTNEVKGLLNGVEQWSFIDTANHAVPTGNILNFFVDDNATSQRETFAGSVEYIRISDDIPEPGTAVLLMGLAGLGMATRRRQA